MSAGTRNFSHMVALPPSPSEKVQGIIVMLNMEVVIEHMRLKD